MEKEVVVQLPKLGESIVSATVVQWFKNEGEKIEKDEPLLEVSTDKVNSEIPSPVSGKVKKILVQKNQTVEVGKDLAVITLLEDTEQQTRKKESSQSTSSQAFYSPAVIRLAKEHNISMKELEKIPIKSARLSKKDLDKYIHSKDQQYTHKTSHEKIKMSHMRKKIADNMTKSFYETPHATVITEVDVDDIVRLIKEKKETFFVENHAKLSITSFVARAMCRAIKEFPLINASLENDTIVMKHYINLGFAVHVDDGLQVPVIKNCHQLNLTQIAKQISSLAGEARRKQLKIENVQEGSITLTNFGMTGALIGIPLIRYPEVAIVGLGAIQKKVVVKDDDQTQVRAVMAVSLTFDHRVLDGIYGCNFLNSIKTHLEKDLTLD